MRRTFEKRRLKSKVKSKQHSLLRASGRVRALTQFVYCFKIFMFKASLSNKEQKFRNTMQIEFQ